MENVGRNWLKQLKKAAIEGEEAHLLFSPPARPKFSRDEILTKNPKIAAVNIVLYYKDKRWFFPLIERTINPNDRHSGQISLPGGKYESEDENYETTAIRETSEEIGLEIRSIKIIRPLTTLYIPPSNFLVYPFLSFTKKNPIFKIQSSEAVKMIECPVSELLTLTEIPKIEVLPATNGRKVPVININNHQVWGATAMILSEFSQLIKKNVNLPDIS